MTCHRATSRSSYCLPVAVLVLVLPMVLTGGTLLLAASAPGGSASVAADFTLTDQNGRPVRLSQFSGKVVLFTFIYTHCTDICPLVTQKQTEVQKKLAMRGLFGSKVVFLTMTFDPERDTVPVMKVFAKRFRAEVPGWYFLTGSPAQIKTVLAAYEIPVRRGHNGLFEHAMPILVIDQQRRLLGNYEHDFKPESMLRDLIRLTGN
jgi:protein SCO1/2